MSIFKSDLAWFGAEGSTDGVPVIIRGRQFSAIQIQNAGLPFALEIRMSYAQTDSTGLPSSEQYESISEFELRVIDKMESAELGITTLIATQRGSVKYLFYLKNSDDAVQRLNQFIDDNDPIEMAGGDDPNWERYKRGLAGITKA